MVSLDVTDKCNASCQKCLLRQIKTLPDMTLENFDTLIKMLPNTVKSIMWGGMGEPLLNPDTPAMICKAKEHGFHTILYTNGTIPHENLRGYIDEINYNSDTISPKNMIVANQSTAINYVLHNQNCDKLSSFITTCPTKHLTVTPYRQMYPGVILERTDLTAHKLSNVEKLTLMEQAAKCGTTLTFQDNLLWKDCSAPWFQVNISHDLQVTPCCIHQHPIFFNMGKLSKTNSIMDIWYGETYKKLRESLTRSKPPSQCYFCGS
jgi:MoaA/NifB/PqqE/SkfB family radical SAM enzyme